MFNNFFTLSETSDEKMDTYDNCIRICTKSSKEPKMCYPMCAQIFPIIKEKCAFEQGCWKDGVYDSYCLKMNKQNLLECCHLQCSNTREISNCDLYCSEYDVFN